MTEYKRQCPVCGKDVFHTSKSNLNKMLKYNPPCQFCRAKSSQKYKIETFVRNCLDCGKEIQYKSRKLYNQAVKRNSKCGHCAHKIECSHDKKIKISLANSGENNGMFGKRHTQKYREILSKKLKQNPLRHTDDGVEKMRISLRKKYANRLLVHGYKSPRVNPKACQFIEKYGIENGFHFQHGMNGGEVYFSEVGAFVDGYDKSRNVVFEYDEKHHFDIDGKLKKKDLIRMADLIKHIKCKVIRYNERENIIQEYY